MQEILYYYETAKHFKKLKFSIQKMSDNANVYRTFLFYLPAIKPLFKETLLYRHPADLRGINLCIIAYKKSDVQR